MAAHVLDYWASNSGLADLAHVLPLSCYMPCCAANCRRERVVSTGLRCCGVVRWSGAGGRWAAVLARCMNMHCTSGRQLVPCRLHPALCSRLHAARGTLQWLQEGPRDCRQCEPRQRSWLAVRAMYSADVPCTERTQGRARGMQPCRAAGLATWRASSSCVILSGSVTRRMAFSMVLVRMMRLAQSSHMAPSDLHTRSAAASRPSSDYAHHTTGTPAAEIPRQCA